MSAGGWNVSLPLNLGEDRNEASVAALAIAGLGLAATPAAAQVEQIAIKQGKAYKHPHSKIELAATIDGMPRTRLTQHVPDALDVVSVHETPAQDQLLSIYIYRHVTGSVPVWFDRARATIEVRKELYGVPVPFRDAAAFTPPGQSSASGLIVTYAGESGRPYRSTSLALFPVGEWLVKIRYSSETLEAAELDKRVRGLLSTIRWPGKIPAAPAAVQVLPCTSALAVNGRSKDVPVDTAAMLMTAMLGSIDPKELKDAKPVPPVIWCRDSTVIPHAGVYRPSGTTDAYLVAIQDAGRGILVEPDAARAMLAEDGMDKGKVWSVQMIAMGYIRTIASQDRLPPPDQGTEIGLNGKTISSVNTWGKNRSISINSDALKTE